MSLPGVMKHVRLLEEANLVTTEKRGRSRECSLGPERMEDVVDWIERYLADVRPSLKPSADQQALYVTERGEPVSHSVVVRLDGNNAAEGRRILDEAEHDVVELVDTMDAAAKRVAELAAAK
jgi:succinyl-CoA synthetase beta subunit